MVSRDKVQQIFDKHTVAKLSNFTRGEHHCGAENAVAMTRFNRIDASQISRWAAVSSKPINHAMNRHTRIGLEFRPRNHVPQHKLGTTPTLTPARPPKTGLKMTARMMEDVFTLASTLHGLHVVQLQNRNRHLAVIPPLMPKERSLQHFSLGISPQAPRAPLSSLQSFNVHWATFRSR